MARSLNKDCFEAMAKERKNLADMEEKLNQRDKDIDNLREEYELKLQEVEERLNNNQ